MAEIVIKLVNGELAGKTMQEINRSVRDASKELSKAKVGTEEWVKAHEKLDGAKKLQGDLKKQIDGTSSASDLLKKSLGGVAGQIPAFGALGNILGQTKSGVGGLTSSFGLLKAAVIGTGIGALVLLLTTLVNWLKKVNTGADFLEDTLAALGATVDVLSDRLGRFVNGLIKFVSGDFQAGIDEMGESFKGVGDEIARDVKLAQELAAATRDLEDAEIDYKIRAAETENQIKALMLQARNRTLSEKERIALLDQALALEKGLNQELMKNSEEGLRIANENAASRLNISREVGESEIAFGKRILEEFKKDGQIQDDDLRDKVVDMLVTLEEGEGKSIELQEKIQNQRDALAEKQAEEDRKRREREAKEREKAAQDELNAARNIEDLKVQVMDEGLEKQIAQINNETDQKIAALVGSEAQITEQKLLLEEQRQQQIAEVQDKWAKEQQAKSIGDLETQLSTEQNIIAEQLLAGQITEDQFLQQTEQNAIAFQKRKLDLIKAAHGEQSAEYQRAYAELLALQQAQADQAVAIEKQKEQDMLAAMQGSLGTFGNFFNTIAGLQAQGTAQWKSFATTAAILSTIQGAINAYTSTAAIPVVGSVLAPIAAAAALAAGYANVRKIQNTKVEPPVKKARRGLVLRGPSHAQGGIPVEAEGDEIIMTKGVFRNPSLRAMASAINVAGGGISFAAGGVPSNPFSDRGPVARDGSPIVVTQSNEKPAWVDDLIAAQDRRIDRFKVVNVVTETEEGIKTVNQIRDDADV